MFVTTEELERQVTLRPGGHRSTAERLASWADVVDDASEVPRAELLVAAGDEYGFAGDHEHRLASYREAVADGGPVHPDARCYLVAALTDEGLGDEADTVIAELLGTAGLHPHALEFIGETLEAGGRYLEASALFTYALEHAAVASPADRLMLQHGRRRCREALGLPPDAGDLSARAAITGPPTASREVELVGYLPREAYTGVEDETYEEQVRRIDREQRATSTGLPVVLVSMRDLPEYAMATGADPTSTTVLRDFLLEQDKAGRGSPWPPGRNDPCWCGAGAKYKRCCGRA